MKTGLVTFHAAHHYGAMLQACALAKTAAAVAGECELIDYVRPDNLEAGRVFQRGFSPGVTARNLHSLLRYSAFRRRYGRFENFVQEVMRLSPERYLTIDEITAAPPRYDVTICGSDQIWNPFIFHEQRFDPVFFASFAQSGRKVAYAPSFGAAAVEGAVADELRGLVQGFSHLSAREARGAEILGRASGREVPVVLDPTLLMEKDEWAALAAPPPPEDKPYLLCYFVSPPGRLTRFINDIKRNRGAGAVQLAGTRRKAPGVGNVVFDAGPREFLSLFQNAAFVLTNSFHGAVFSILFEKPFVCSAGGGEDGQSSRTGNLLATLGLSGRLIANGETDITDIDYNSVGERLRAERERSMAYLRAALTGG
jgi:hypothetical protein